ncbi:hypothetical protein AGIG_G3571 [Arapaima gigas]
MSLSVGFPALRRSLGAAHRCRSVGEERSPPQPGQHTAAQASLPFGFRLISPQPGAQSARPSSEEKQEARVHISPGSSPNGRSPPQRCRDSPAVPRVFCTRKLKPTGSFRQHFHIWLNSRYQKKDHQSDKDVKGRHGVPVASECSVRSSPALCCRIIFFLKV